MIFLFYACMGNKRKYAEHMKILRIEKFDY